MYTTQFRPASQGAFLPAVRLAGAPRQLAGPSFGYSRQTFGGRAHGTPAFLGQVQLGATAEEWFKRARASLERFRFLKGQIETVNNEVGRASIYTWLGSPSVVDSPEYRYATVLQDFTFDASPENEGIQAYAVSRRQNRVTKLEEYNDDLNEKIEASRITYGSRPAPDKNGAKNGKPPAGPDLTWPIVGVGAAIALAVLLG